jgi:hypothetical protein
MIIGWLQGMTIAAKKTMEKIKAFMTVLLIAV